MNSNKLKKAFTVAEALIILLAVSLLAVAAIPALTRKHVKIGTHGRWICTVDENGNHYVATEYKGKFSDFQYVGASCSFTPPANAQNISIKAVAGGGGGARGESGDEEVIYSSDSYGEVFVTSVPNEGYYRVIAVGGGGSGGGIGCGEYKKYYKDATTLFDEDLSLNMPGGSNTGSFFKEHSSYDNLSHQSTATKMGYKWNPGTQRYDTYVDKVNATSSDIVYPKSVKGKTYTYGYVYKKYSGFDYSYLVQNDFRYSPETTKSTKTIDDYDDSFNKSEVSVYDFKYNHLPANMQQKYQVCFPTGYAQDVLPFAKPNYAFLGSTVSGMYVSNGKPICWNLPSQGGERGEEIRGNYRLQAGGNIVVSVGRGGISLKGDTSETIKDHDTKEYTAMIGDVDFAHEDIMNGQESSVSIGSERIVAAGGAAGYTRRRLSDVAFKNIPLQICAIEKTTYSSYKNNTDYACSALNGESSGYNNCDGNNVKGCVVASSAELERVKTCTGTGGEDDVCRTHVGGDKDSCEKVEYTETTTTTDADGNEVKTENPKQCVAVMETYYNTTCKPGTHEGAMYKIGTCENVIKSSYFAAKKISACVSTRATSYGDEDGYNDEVQADIPTVHEYEKEVGTKDESVVRRVWIDGEGGDAGETVVDDQSLGMPEAYMKVGKYASGGYGIGITSASYLTVYGAGSTVSKGVRFQGYDGEDGYVMIKRISHTSGGGGQAGQYLTTNLKKTGKLVVTVGKGGGVNGNNRSGRDGGDTKISQIVNGQEKVLFVLKGGKGGIAPASDPEITEDAIAGTDGALSPFESPYNKAKVIPYGGKNGSNSSFDGISPATPKWKNSNNKASYLLRTYGAGGGGGGASKTKAGEGGFGAAGAVIIEW